MTKKLIVRKINALIAVVNAIISQAYQERLREWLYAKQIICRTFAIMF